MADAKAAVLAFAESAFGLNRRTLGPSIAETFKALMPHSVSEPLPGGRRSESGEPLDRVAPSVWHAAATLLQSWFIARVNPSFGLLPVYRGQANPWPIAPTRWRSSEVLRNLQHRPLSAYRDFVAGHLPDGEEVTISNFSSFTDDAGISALAQHYGFPTNLVDFTFNPLVALHFASLPCEAMANHALPGHAVVLQTTFDDLQVLSDSSDVRMELILLPPIPVATLYQQAGFFVDFGDRIAADKDASPDRLDWSLVEQRCGKLYFPRHYPIASDGHELLGPEQIMQYVSHGTDPFYAEPTMDVHRYWYLEHSFFSDSLKALKAYCETSTSEFREGDALAALEAAPIEAPPPWDPLPDFLTGAKQTLNAAETLNLAVSFLIEAAGIFTDSGLEFDPVIIGAFEKANPRFFRAFIDTAMHVDLYNLPGFAAKVVDALMTWQQIEHLLSTSRLSDSE